MTTVQDICLNADAFRAAYPGWPHPEPGTSPCRICGKRPDQPHDSATRGPHTSHLTRYGWSGMCPAPRDETPKEA